MAGSRSENFGSYKDQSAGCRRIVVGASESSLAVRAEVSSLSMTVPEESLQAQLEERLRFEMLLSDLSAAFVRICDADLDTLIIDAQRRVCESLGLDLSAVWQWSGEESRFLTLTHLYRPLGGPPVPERMDAQEHFPWFLRKMLDGEVIATSTEDLPPEAARDREVLRYYGIKSNVAIPLFVGEELPMGVVSFDAVLAERTWSEAVVNRLQLAAQILANALARRKAEDKLRNALSEVRWLKERLEAENIYLHQDIKKQYNFGNIIGRSEGLRYVLYRLEQVAPTDATVLVLGETGTGKGVLAHAIHGRSARNNRPLITVNCGALPANLIESELFGREKGAFTGSHARRIGRFELADKGTIFLDEIGEMPLESQAKLLRVIQDGEFERLGNPHTVKVNVRVIASTSRDLKEQVTQGLFREDLFYRLNVFPITIPPLRQRGEDISLLVEHFVKKFSQKFGKEIDSIPKETMKALQDYSWPGNIRELENVIERAVIISQGRVLCLAEWSDIIPPLSVREGAPLLKIDDVEREHILRVLAKTQWRIEGRDGAAVLLGLRPSTLRSRIQRLGICRPDRTTSL